MSSKTLTAGLSLAEKKRLLIRKRLSRNLSQGILPIPKRATATPPLSFAQRRLWFLDQLQGPSATYNIPAAYRLFGNLDVAALKQALHEVVSRHESLRTNFRQQDGQAVQHISATPDLPFPLYDLVDLPSHRQKTELKGLLAMDAALPFDLQQGPLFRAALVKLGSQSHVLMFNHHHIVTDGWSLGLLTNELSALYECFRQGKPSPLRPLPIQYGDFSCWQVDWLTGDRSAAHLAWWSTFLKGAPSVLALPTDRVRPVVNHQRGDFAAFEIPGSLAAKLSQFTKKHNATLFMTLLSAFYVLLARLSGETDLVVGSPVAGRTRPESEKLIGLFINTLPLRASVADNPFFPELLGQVRDATLTAFDHQDLPFENLVEALQPERNQSYSPLFQVMFILQSQPKGKARFGSLQIEPIPSPSLQSKFDLTLTLTEKPDGLSAGFRYNSDLFDRQSAVRFGRFYQHLLTELVADPKRPVLNIPLATPARDFLLHGRQPLEPLACFHQQFEAAAARFPKNEALVCRQPGLPPQILDYQTTNRRANQLAHHLIRLGAQPDSIFAICMARSPEMVVAMLAVLKAGAAYLPLDPLQPAAHRRQLLTQANPRLLLADTGSAFAEIETIVVDGGNLVLHGQPMPVEPGHNPGLRSDPANLAYVMFTSGSTGRPKAVALEHRQLSNYIQGVREALDLPQWAKYAQVSSFAADLGNTMVLPALAGGGTLHIIPADLLTNSVAFARYMDQFDMDCLKMTPSHLEALLADGGSRLFPKQRLVLGGEALPCQLATKLAHLAPKASIYNHFGPTETCVGVLTHPISETPAGYGGRSVPLGRPLPGTVAYLLDTNLQPVPEGLPGELYLAGANLARGYLGAPALTAERFLPDIAGKGSRMYRTGDRVLCRPGMLLEFLGRMDCQLKIRGFRVEPGEVEAALRQLDGVREAAVTAQKPDGEEVRLAAYVCGAPDLAPHTLLENLRAVLPAHMVPSTLMVLNSFPLTANGKLDRAGLPKPKPGTSKQKAQAPRGHIEQVLAALWRQFLNCGDLSRQDNFFERGGHSLLAIRVLSRVQQTFHVDVTLRHLFANPELAAFATCLEDLSDTAPLRQNPIEPVTRDAVLPLSFAQQRLWFLQQWDEGAGYNMPVALRLRGPLDHKVLTASFNEILARHEVLRTCIQAPDGEPQQVIMPATDATMSRVDLSALPAVERDRALKVQVQQEVELPFNLMEESPIRLSLLRLDRHDHVLLVTLHHIVSDGGSMGILLAELAIIYTALLEGKPSPLDKLPLQYADFAAWQRQLLDGPQGDILRTFWKQQLTGAPDRIGLPTDRPYPAALSNRGTHLTIDLNRDLSEGLRALSLSSGTTMFLTLQAAFIALLSRYCGEDDLVIGTPVDGRSRCEWEPLIGLFVNSLALRTNLSDNPGFACLLDRVRKTNLDAHAHQHLPFEQLVDDLKVTRDPNRHPIFQVMFLYAPAAPAPAELPGLALSSLVGESSVSQFELALTMGEGQGGLFARFEYNTDLFNEVTIERLGSAFRLLLEAVVDNPQQKVRDLPLINPATRNLLLYQFNDTVCPIPERCVHHLIEDRVRATPELPALLHRNAVGGRFNHTYASLNRQANRLAHLLVARGVGPETLVGLHLDRSVELSIALLAVWKAGAAYVPLDPDYPAERLAFMIADAGLELVLSRGDLAEALPSGPATTILLNTIGDLLAARPDTNPTSAVQPFNRAGLIYTSGSTGKPKGATFVHGGLVNYTLDMVRRFGLTKNDRILQVAAPGFDVLLEELLPTWSAGATLVIRSGFRLSEGADLNRAIAQDSISGLELTTAYWHEWVAELVSKGSGPPACLRFLLMGGEAVLPERYAAWCEFGVPLINVFGLTEAHITSTLFVQPEGKKPIAADYRLPIGKPVANTSIYLLDKTMNPVLLGLPGELFIGGEGLARGLHGSPGLSAARFVPDPFANRRGARLYRTGDNARWCHDGNLIFLGRRDNQVKIRGFRIELAEVEAALDSLPQIRESVVVVREVHQGDKHLVAYLVLQSGEKELPLKFRSQLTERLPAHFIPSAFVILEKLPLTANGKLDRNALPAPERGTMAGQAVYQAPRSSLEEDLVHIWCEVLNLKKIGINDNFFELGGHSISATRVVTRMRTAFGVELPLRRLFEAPTIGELAPILVAVQVVEAEEDEMAQLLAEIEGLSDEEALSRI